MAITPGTKLVIKKAQEIAVFPAMSAQPLQNALANTNHLYGYFRPLLLSWSPMGSSPAYNPGITPTFIPDPVVYVVPVLPSQDGLHYDFMWTLFPKIAGGGTSRFTLQVEWTSGVDPTVGTGSTPATKWVNLYGPAMTSPLTDSVWNTRTISLVLDRTATMLRFTVTAVDGPYTLGHVAVQPSVITSITTPATYASGFLPFDPSFISQARAPINTEMVDRCKTNALSVLRDRAQCLASLVQPYTTTTGSLGGVSYYPRGIMQVMNGSAASANFSQTIGMAAAGLPAQKTFTGHVRYLINDTAPSVFVGAGTLTVTGDDGSVNQLSLDSTGQLEHGVVQVTTLGNPDSFVKVQVDLTAKPAYSTYLYALIIFWTPGA